jgi:hypothetical protein
MRRLVPTVAGVVAAPVIAASPMMYPVPSNAIDPGHTVIAPNVSEQDHFFLNEKYPSSSAVEHYNRVFSGWRACFGEKQWSSFGDRSSGEERFIHQLTRHWVNAANNESVTLALRYTSPGLRHRASPDSDRQFVVLVRLKQPNASQTLKEMGVTCGKDT